MKHFWISCMNAHHMLKKVGLFITMLGVAVCSTAFCQDIVGRYKYNDGNIRLTITIPQEKPAAVIVIQYLPPQTIIISSNPAYSSYDIKTGMVKWLFSDIDPGLLRINVQLSTPVEGKDIKAEVLFKDRAGISNSNSYSIEPLPMKRKGLEGC